MILVLVFHSARKTLQKSCFCQTAFIISKVSTLGCEIETFGTCVILNNDPISPTASHVIIQSWWKSWNGCKLELLVLQDEKETDDGIIGCRKLYGMYLVTVFASWLFIVNLLVFVSFKHNLRERAKKIAKDVWIFTNL